MEKKSTSKRADREYIFHGITLSLCPECHERIVSKIILQDGKVYLLKCCPVHGEMKCLLEEDANYYLSMPQYNKPGTICKTQTQTLRGCPFDCGLCPDHEQHSCINLIDVTNACNLSCPMCYASSGSGRFHSLEKIEEMMDFCKDSEYGHAEILQISGGEPTMHPDILTIIEMAKKKNFKYVMLNTNGIRLAADEKFCESLGKLKGKFEVYLQFDGFKKETYETLRGRDLLEIKKKALQNLARHEVPVTLVSTIRLGVNDDEIGELIRFGLGTEYVRGINFQPIGYFGRLSKGKDDALHRVTLSGIVSRIENQTKGLILKSDMVPLPCHPDRIALTYLYRDKRKRWMPITRKIDIRKYLSIISNSIAFRLEDLSRKSLLGLWSASSVLSSFRSLRDFSCCIPIDVNLLSKAERVTYVNENTFRISIVSFLDAYNFDVKSVKQECIHFITPDKKKIPFSTYNLLYRSKRNDLGFPANETH